MSARLKFILFLISFFNFLFSSKSIDCPHLYCDFENDLCCWRHETTYTKGLKWIHSQLRPCRYDEPSCQHESDRYLYTTSRYLTGNGSFVRLGHYPLPAQLSGKCTLSLKYIAYGIGFAKLVIGVRMVGDREPEPILVIHTSKETDWRQIKVPLIADYIFTPTIEVVRLDNTESIDPIYGFVAIDDTSISHSCLGLSDFDQDHHKDLILNEGESSRGLKKRSKPDRSKVSRVIFSGQSGLPGSSSSQGSKGHHQRSKNQLRSISRAKKRKQQERRCTGSIDDDPRCQVSSARCTEDRGLCDFKVDCDDGSDEYRCPSYCDLDRVTDQEEFSELCGWSQTRSGTQYATWIVISGSHASKYLITYPKLDATLGKISGKYLILNLVDLEMLPPVHLNSPTFFKAKSTCYFTFSYIIYDTSAVFYITLTVESSDDSVSGSTVSILWKNNNSIKPLLSSLSSFEANLQWKNASAYIGRQENPFYLTFSRSSASHSPNGTVAIDNMRFTAC